MSIKDIFLGAIIGALDDGFDGAIAGGLSGAGMDKLSEYQHMRKFLSCQFSILALASKCDGRINKKEVEFSYEYLATLKDGFNNYSEISFDSLQKIAKDSFNSAAKIDSPIDSCLNFIYKNTNSEASREVFLVVIMLACSCDGEINIDEEKFIYMVSRGLNISDERCRVLLSNPENMDSSFERKNNSDRQHEDNNQRNHENNNNNSNKETGNKSLSIYEAYKIIECEYGSGESEVKKCYRKKISEYHPDKIQGMGLPQNFVDFANEQTKLINAAYSLIINNMQST